MLAYVTKDAFSQIKPCCACMHTSAHIPNAAYCGLQHMKGAKAHAVLEARMQELRHQPQHTICTAAVLSVQSDVCNSIRRMKMPGHKMLSQSWSEG